MVRFMMYFINFLNTEYAVKHEHRPTLTSWPKNDCQVSALVLIHNCRQLCTAVKGNEPGSMAITISKWILVLLSAKTTVRTCAISLTSVKPMTKKIPKLTSPSLASRRPTSLSCIPTNTGD